MEPNIQNNEFTAIESQIRESYGRVAYSHKVHEKMADICLTSLRRIKLAEIFLSALATTSLVYTLLGDSKASTIVAAVCSTLLFCLALYTKEYNLGEIAQKHADAASKLWFIRETFLSLLTDIKSGTFAAEIARKERNKLIQSLSTIHTAAPRTNSKAYKEAQLALKINEELTFSDEEIDKLLPSNLRKSPPSSATHNENNEI